MLPDLTLSNFLNRHNIQERLHIAIGARMILQIQFDFDVYLPSRDMNLQRPLVWTQEQKKALIESVIVRRYIPPISVLYTVDDVYQVIDGKQRLSTIISYLNNEFEFCGYLYKDLPKEYQGQVNRFDLVANRLLEDYGQEITDDEKVEWFAWINFAGTKQDVEHLNRLKS